MIYEQAEKFNLDTHMQLLKILNEIIFSRHDRNIFLLRSISKLVKQLLKHQDKKEYWAETKARFPGIELYCTQTEIASYFGVSKSTMHRIMKQTYLQISTILEYQF